MLTRIKSFFSGDQELYLAIFYLTGVRPSNTSLYRLALTHRSATGESKFGLTANNERLEFLGDAVISAIVGKYLFQRFPLEDEGYLTEARSRIVSRKVLNELAIRIKLPSLVEKNIPDVRSTSSLPGDAFEALIGAIFLDRGYPHAEAFVLRCFASGVIDLDRIIREDNNFKSRLIEWCQRNKKKFSFDLIEELTRGHDTIFVIHAVVDGQAVGSGKERSKKLAEQVAAKEACEKLAMREGSL